MPTDDIEVPTEPGLNSAVVTYTATATDNVKIASSSCTPASGSRIPVANYYPFTPTVVECSATDLAGNTASASFEIIVYDNQRPVWNIPGDMTVSTDSGLNTATVNYVATPTDNVGIRSSSCTPASGSVFALGTTNVYCTATDDWGAVTSTSFNITVSDQEAPTWSVPADMHVPTDAGSTTATVTYSATASDNVGVVSSNCSPVSGSVFSLGTTTVTCSASDAAENTGNASFNITVSDQEAPTWSVPADIQTTATGSGGIAVTYSASASDNVGVISQSCTPLSGSLFGFGTTIVTCTASDAAGNVGSASFNVTVLDIEAPTWSIPADIETITTSINGSVVTYSASASDNVGVTSQSCTPPSGSLFGLGTTTVTCTASDAAGNVGNASFNVTVNVDSGSTDILISGIAGMGLEDGVTRSLTGVLKESSNTNATCGKLNAFLTIVANRLAQGEISQSQADQLTNFAQAIISSLGC